MKDLAENLSTRPQRRRVAPAVAFLTAGALALASVSGQLGATARAQNAPAAAAPQAIATPGDEDRLSQPQLEQLLAPIALYPDELLMQVLISATYPLEVVQASRWLGQGQNAALRGDALVQALAAQPWDPSVKSLVPFPDVLTLMNDQLDWTQQVGDAVLGQQDDVLNAVQVLRGRAQANGSLQSGPQQTVNVTQNVTVAPAAGAVVAPPAQTIIIAPTNPEQVFVPAYNPSVVYGSWPYAAYPPAYYPPPAGWGVGNAILTGMAFAGGVAVVSSLWGWARPGWGRGDVDIDVNRYNNINVNRTQITGDRWQHDAAHRGGVAYRNDQVRDRVGAGRTGGGADRVQAREQFRGRADVARQGGGPADRRPDGDGPALADRRPGGDGPGVADRRPGGAGPGSDDRRPDGNRPNLADRAPGGEGPGVADRRGPSPDRPAATAQRPAVQQHASGRPQARPQAASARPAPQAMQGVGQGGQERAAAQRGQASRQGQPAARAQSQQRQAAQRSSGGGGGGRSHGENRR
jgi:hypothetical protein